MMKKHRLITILLLGFSFTLGGVLAWQACSRGVVCVDSCVSRCETPQCKKELGAYACQERCRYACKCSCSDE